MEKKNFLDLLIYNFLPLVIVVCAVILALKGVKGWGWLIFAAMMLYKNPKHLIKIKMGDTKGKKSKKGQSKKEGEVEEEKTVI
jgi:hypothetical protein